MNKKIPSAIAIITVVGFFSVIFMLFSQPIPTESRDALNIMLGFLGGVLASITSFYFGSSDKG